MRTTRPLAALLAAATLAVAVPCAFAEDAPPKAPAPAAEMANLKVFDGSWTCEGKVMPTPMGPGGAMTGTVESHADLGGYWQSRSEERRVGKECRAWWS